MNSIFANHIHEEGLDDILLSHLSLFDRIQMAQVNHYYNNKLAQFCSDARRVKGNFSAACASGNLDLCKCVLAEWERTYQGKRDRYATGCGCTKCDESNGIIPHKYFNPLLLDAGVPYDVGITGPLGYPGPDGWVGHDSNTIPDICYADPSKPSNGWVPSTYYAPRRFVYRFLQPQWLWGQHYELPIFAALQTNNPHVARWCVDTIINKYHETIYLSKWHYKKFRKLPAHEQFLQEIKLADPKTGEEIFDSLFREFH